MMKRLTPILLVDHIEDQLPFWQEKLGFTVSVSVPENDDGEKLGFVMLHSGETELMLQTWNSVKADMGIPAHRAQSFLYIEVNELDVIEQRLSDVEKLFPRRETFYGATEIGVYDPAGNVVTFAMFKQAHA